MSRIQTVILALVLSSQVSAVIIDNGITGDGSWSVDAGDAGDTTVGNLDPAGPQGVSDLVFEFQTYVDIGADGTAELISGTTSTAATLSGSNQVTSSGSFPGANGSINWTAVASIPAGTQIYQVQLTFASAAAFGPVRLINYFDEDVLGSGDDVLIVSGTPGAADFLLLTVDNADNVGIGHYAGYNTATGMSYAGWAANVYDDLQVEITGATAVNVSVAGVVNTTNLPVYSDPRYPGLAAYGPRDITNAFAFDLDPAATSASVTFFLGGAPSGTIPGGPVPGAALPVPMLSSLHLFLLMMVLAVPAAWRLRHRIG